MTHETAADAVLPARRRHRRQKLAGPGALRHWERPSEAARAQADENAWLHCGWGRLLFAHTFAEPADLVAALREEAPGERDIALYVADPQVALSQAPQEVFLDPSHTYRLNLATYAPARRRIAGVVVGRPRDGEDAAAANAIQAKCAMVQTPVDFLLAQRAARQLTHLVARDEASGRVLGTVMGVDHVRAFNDPEGGSSLWCLATDPQAGRPRVGEALVRYLAEHFQARGRAWMDLSVLHDNEAAIALYEKLGFRRVPAFCLKHKNPVNQPLFTGPDVGGGLNPYARIIVKEARRRGIGVEVEDAEGGLFRLLHAGRRIDCRESLSALTSAVALARCDDKALTRRLLVRHGLRVPAQAEAGDAEDDAAFLARHGRVVVKPARGEQGRGITVDVREPATLRKAVETAASFCERVLLEQFCEGQDLRIVVIGHKTVAAAVRRPAEVSGDGRRTVAELIERHSRRRAAATGGESRIPLDAETERCVAMAGYALDDVPPAGEAVQVRRTANLHTGGTIHDVTGILHPALAEAAEQASRVLDIPVVGFDFLVPDPAAPGYVVIEANERPGLANHEPQPTAERFVDLLFPETAS